MRRLALLTLLFSTSAFAQQAPPFVPYTISQEQHQALLTALGEIPAKHSIPLIQALIQLEQRAVEEKKRAESEKKPE